MPKSDEGEDDQVISNGSSGPSPAAGAAPSKRNKEVSNNPSIVTSMPPTPELDSRGCITHTTDHILGWIDAIYESPKTEETPRDEEFKPDDVEVEVAQHTELHGCE
jgi:hypothetical protein